jgi:hypothetical protein
VTATLAAQPRNRRAVVRHAIRAAQTVEMRNANALAANLRPTMTRAHSRLWDRVWRRVLRRRAALEIFGRDTDHRSRGRYAGLVIDVNSTAA